MLDTLLDLGSSFGDWLSEGFSSITEFFADGPAETPEAVVPEPYEAPEPTPMPEAPLPEAPAPGGIIESAAPEKSSSVLDTFTSIFESGDKERLAQFSSTLSDQDKKELLRAALSAGGSGAAAMLRQAQEKNNREFQGQQTDRMYEERRGTEDRARAERERNGTPARLNISTSPRGIVGSRMGA